MSNAVLYTALVSALTLSITLFIALYQPPKRQFHRFLDLPAEIREQIYPSLFKDTSAEIGPYIPGVPTPPRPLIPPIAATCRSIRREALSSYFNTTHFKFYMPGRAAKAWIAWLNRQDDKAIASIRTFELACHTVRKPRLHSGRGVARTTLRDKKYFHHHFFHVDVRAGVVEVLDSEKSCSRQCLFMSGTERGLRWAMEELKEEDGARYLTKDLLRDILLGVCEMELDGDDESVIKMLRDPEFRGFYQQ